MLSPYSSERLYAQDKESMLHLTRAIDKATGCVFVPSATATVPEDADVPNSVSSAQRPNEHGLLASAMGPLQGPRSDPRDVQERWIDAREEWDAWEKAQWRREGQLVQEMANKAQIRERNPSGSSSFNPPS